MQLENRLHPQNYTLESTHLEDIRSFFWWDGELKEEDELRATIDSEVPFAVLLEALAADHPYDLPMIVSSAHLGSEEREHKNHKHVMAIAVVNETKLEVAHGLAKSIVEVAQLQMKDSEVEHFTIILKTLAAAKDQIEVEFGGLHFDFHPIQANEQYLKWIEDNTVVRPHAGDPEAMRPCPQKRGPFTDKRKCEGAISPPTQKGSRVWSDEMAKAVMRMAIHKMSTRHLAALLLCMFLSQRPFERPGAELASHMAGDSPEDSPEEDPLPELEEELPFALASGDLQQFSATVQESHLQPVPQFHQPDLQGPTGPDQRVVALPLRERSDPTGLRRLGMELKQRLMQNLATPIKDSLELPYLLVNKALVDKSNPAMCLALLVTLDLVDYVNPAMFWTRTSWMWSSSFWTFGPMAFYSNKPYEFYTTTASGKCTSTFNSGNTYKSAWSTGCQFEDFSNATRSLGEVSCGVPDSSQPTDMESLLRQLVSTLGGERKSQVPTWSGAPNLLRQWLKSLGLWEQETSLPKSKWGLRLYAALTDDAKRIADTVPMDELVTERGYSAILTALMSKYKPYLEAVGPSSVDSFLYLGERGPKESFAAYLARKEVQRQELESQIGEKLQTLVAGRVLLRQANLTEQQQQLLALKMTTLATYEEVIQSLRPLDRLDSLAKAGGLPGAATTTNKTYMTAEPYDYDYFDEDEEEEDGEADDYDYEEDGDSVEDGMLQFEDREYDEMEAVYVQAYNDVRKDLRSRRNERGFVNHRGKKQKGSGKGGRFRRKGRGKGRGGKAPKRDDSFVRGTEQELLARTRCFNCQELGHISRNCPMKPSKKQGGGTNFVTVGTGPKASPKAPTSSTMMTSRTTSSIFVFSKVNSEATQRSLTRAIYACVRCRANQCVVDTAAEDAVTGSQAYEAMVEELASLGLRPVPVKQQGIPCAGIGGQAQLRLVADVPTCIAGLLGIIRFSVIEDTENFVTPPLLPISYLEAVGSTLDFIHDVYTTQDGHSTVMTRLPSGHRAVSLFEFDITPWNLPPEHRVNGFDPFVLPAGRSSHSFLGGSGIGGIGFCCSFAWLDFRRSDP
ncbi:unnamed protein product [Durusdinium trenchii]|uniref:CCHC-type domain-containing protein n=1 Tax=Durusdinium trenchii TaxID=1381693 RepID=A0ABP0RV70_9DINO